MFFRKPTRRFTVFGTLVRNAYREDVTREPGSVTTLAHDHDDAERRAQQSYPRDCEFFPSRYFKVERVVEHRRGRR